MASTSGQKTAAAAHAKPVSTTGALTHAFVAMQSFCMAWNGCVITYVAGQRYVADSGLKAALQATDRDIVWET